MNSYKDLIVYVDPVTQQVVVNQGFADYLKKEKKGAFDTETLPSTYTKYAQSQYKAALKEANYEAPELPDWYDPSGKLDDKTQFRTFLRNNKLYDQVKSPQIAQQFYTFYNQEKAKVTPVVQEAQTYYEKALDIRKKKTMADLLGVDYDENNTYLQWSPVYQQMGYTYDESPEDQQRRELGLPPASFLAEYKGDEEILSGKAPKSVTLSRDLANDYNSFLRDVSALQQSGALTEETYDEAFAKYPSLEVYEEYLNDVNSYKSEIEELTGADKYRYEQLGEGPDEPKSPYSQTVLSKYGMTALSPEFRRYILETLMAGKTVNVPGTEIEQPAQEQAEQKQYVTNGIQKVQPVRSVVDTLPLGFKPGAKKDIETKLTDAKKKLAALQNTSDAVMPVNVPGQPSTEQLMGEQTAAINYYQNILNNWDVLVLLGVNTDPKVISLGKADSKNKLEKSPLSAASDVEQAEGFNAAVTNRGRELTDPQLAAVSLFTQREKDLVNYYYGKKQYDKADKLFKYFSEIHAVEYSQGKAQERLEELTVQPGDPFGTRVQKKAAGISDALGTVANAPVYAAEVLGNQIKNVATGQNAAAPESMNAATLRVEQAGQQSISEGMSPFPKFVTDAVVSTVVNAPSYALNLVAPGAGLAVMATSAAGQTGLQAKDQGATGWQQLGMATLSGTVEWLTEKLPLENFAKIIKPGNKVANSAVKTLLKQAGIEATEELVAEYANALTDIAVMGDKSQYAQFRAQLLASGASEEEATRQANMQFFVVQPAQAAGMGAISGGIMGGGANIIATINTSSGSDNAKAALAKVAAGETLTTEELNLFAPGKSKNRQAFAQVTGVALPSSAAETKQTIVQTITQQKAALEQQAQQTAKYTPKPKTVVNKYVANTKTDTPQFKKWFGNSQVVDEKGNPLVLYHNTTSQFDTFDVTRGFGAAGQGIYMTNMGDAEHANKYGNISMSLYARIENPVDLRGGSEVIDKTSKDLGAGPFMDLNLPQLKAWSGNFRAAVIKAGYDGAIMDGDRPGETYYIAYSPNQVKSATENSGAFDNEKPSILAYSQNAPESPTIESNVQPSVSTTEADVPVVVNPVASRTQIKAVGQNTQSETENIQADAVQTDKIDASFASARQYASKVGNPNSKVTLASVFNAVKQWADIPINTAMFRRPKGAKVTKNMAGWYQAASDVIGTRESLALDTLFHEIGHKLDNDHGLKNGPVDDLKQSYLTNRITQNYKPAQYTAEMIADFTRDYFMNPSAAKQNAPAFYSFFEARFSKFTLAKLGKIKQMFADFMAQSREQKVSGQVKNYGDKQEEPSNTRIKRFINQAEIRLFDVTAPITWMTNTIEKLGDKDVARRPALWVVYAGDAASVASNIITENLVKPMGTDGNHGAVMGGSFASLFNFLKSPAERKAFVAYLVAQHAIDRDAVGKKAIPNLVATTAELNALVSQWEQKYPHFQAKAQELYNWWGKFIKAWYVDTGMLDSSTYDNWRTMYPHYVPFYRQALQGEFGSRITSAGFSGVTTHIKRAKASDLPILNPIESMHRDIVKVVKAVANRQVMLSVLAGVDKYKADLNEFVYEVDASKIAESVRADDTRAKIEKALKDRTNLSDVDIDDFLEVVLPDEHITTFRRTRMSDGTEKDVLTVRDKNGKERFLMSENEMFIECCQSFGSAKLNEFFKGMTKIMTAFKGTVTFRNPFFAIPNGIFRDTAEGLVWGSQKNPAEYAYDWGVSIADAVRSTWLAQKMGATESAATKAYRQVGGGDDVGLYSDTGVNRAVRRVTYPWKSLTAKEKAKKILKLELPLDVVDSFNNTMETINRQAEFSRSKRRGLSDLEGLYNSAEITLNFRRKGKWAKELDAVIPFYNAMMQDLYKTARAVRNSDTAEGRKQLVKVASRLFLFQTLFSMLEAFLHRDDEDYKNLPRAMKDKYWILWKTTSGKFIRVPRPASIFPQFFAGMGRRFMEYILGDEAAFQGFGESMLDQVWPSTLFDPLIAIGQNKTWYGGTIENYADKQVQSVYRYDENTSEIAKALGKLTGLLGKSGGSGFTDGLSPKELQYLIDQYTGVVGDILIPVFTTDTSSSRITNLLANRFLVDPVFSNRQMGDYYDNSDKVEEIRGTIDRQGTYDGLTASPATALKRAENLHYDEINKTDKLITEYKKAVASLDQDFRSGKMNKERHAEKARQLREDLNKELEDVNKVLEQYLRDVLK